MRIPSAPRIVGAALVGLALVAGHAQAAEGSAACDRHCLDGFVTRYLQALVAHDPKRLPLASDVRFTENGQTLALGDGLWGTISGLGGYRHDFDDPQAGEVAMFGTIREGGDPTLLALRLKIVDRRIAEIETIVSRASPMNAKGIAHLEKMGRPNAIWRGDVPPAERMPRDRMIATANMYFSGLQNDDGKGVYPFSDDCNRLENGTQTTNNPTLQYGPVKQAFNVAALGCAAQFKTGYFRMVTRIRDRRFVVVDEQKGAVFAFAFFDHNGTVGDVTLTNGIKVPNGLHTPFTWELGEAFKVEKGKIRQVEAVMTQAPYGMKPGWPD